MKNLNSTALEVFPFQNLEKVGVLLHHEYPTTIIYKTSNQAPILTEWVDCSKQNIDRFLSYESSKPNLAKFLLGELSHLELIKSAIGNLIISFEGDINNPIDPARVSFEEIPEDYLPHREVFLDPQDIVEQGKIFSFLKTDDKINKYRPGLAPHHLVAEKGGRYSHKQ